MNADNTPEQKSSVDLPSPLLAPLAIDVSPDIFTHPHAVQFIAYMEEHCGKQLTEKLVHNIRYISTNASIAALQDSVTATLAAIRIPYALLYDQKNKSGWFFTQKLRFTPQPDYTIPILNKTLKPETVTSLSSLASFLYVDDASYSGSQAASAIQNLLQSTQKDPQTVTLNFVGNTTFARQQITRITGVSTIVSQYHIPTFTEMFTTDEQYELSHAFNEWGGSFKQTVLTYFEHRVPDNFFGPARKYMGLRTKNATRLYFVDDTVPSPYRK